MYNKIAPPDAKKPAPVSFGVSSEEKIWKITHIWIANTF